MVQGKRIQSRIPQFRTLAEEREFWDTHDTTEFEDELQPVEAKFAKPLPVRRMLTRSVTLRLDEPTVSELRHLASERGVGPTTLARMLLLEQLRRERQKAS